MINFNLVTISSSGYEEYTLNLAKSLKISENNNTLNVYCIDKQSFEKLNSYGLNTFLIESETFNNDLKKYGTTEFNKFMYYKMKVVNDLLNKHKHVFYVDSDVVFLNKLDPINNYKKNFEILSMKDFNFKTPQTVYICAGFMIVKSNIKTRKLFNPKKILDNNFKYDDQHLINKRRKFFNNKYLEENLFCNGSYFLNKSNELDPIAVHFNFIIGDKKKEIMKENNMWYVD